MRLKVLTGVISALLSYQIQATTVQEIWQPLGKELSHYQLLNENKNIDNNLFSSNSDYQLNFLYQNITSKIKHQRFQIYYQGLKVFGYQLLLHKYPNNKSMITGHHVYNIEKDITNLNTKFSSVDILASTLKKQGLSLKQIKATQVQKIIYINAKNKKAKLAYLISYMTTPLANPMLIVDANNSEILEQWNNLKTARLGEGPGGNNMPPKPNLRGAFTYKPTPNKLTKGELPRFDIIVNGGNYLMQNKYVEVRDYNASAREFPIEIQNEGVTPNPQVYSYTAPNNNAISQEVVYASGNKSLNPNNDAMFHAATTIEMLLTTYGLSSPIGTDIPIRIYNRVLNLDNAFSIPTNFNDVDKTYNNHQQLVLGSGNTEFYANAQGALPHELCHNVTSVHSDMIYQNQSGGMNESFSDMCEMALNDYIRRILGFAWYWNGTTFNLGENETQSGIPLRYMATPSKDGVSIDRARDFVAGMNVHLSSGVFNRAFYLIATSFPNIYNVQKTFQYMVDANANYWVPNNTFNYGSCGVCQAAYDRGEDYQTMMQAFAMVDVKCILFKDDKQVISNKYSKGLK